MRKRVKYFSLIELIIALGAFALLMLMMFNLLSSSQEGISRINNNFESFSEARVISEYLHKDLAQACVLRDYFPTGNCSLTIKRTTADFTELDFFTFTRPYGEDDITLCRVQWFVKTVSGEVVLLRRVIKGPGIPPFFINTFIYNIPTSVTPLPADTRIVAYGLTSFKVRVYASEVTPSGFTDPSIGVKSSSSIMKAIGIDYSITDPNSRLQGEEKALTQKDFTELIYIRKQ